MRRFLKGTLYSVVASSILAATGCATNAIDESGKRVSATGESMQEKMQQGSRMTRSATSVSVVDSLYIAGKPYRMTDKDKLPSFFNTKIVFNQLEPISFQEVMGNISSDLNTRIVLSSDAIDYITNLKPQNESEEEDSDVVSVKDQSDFAGSGLVGSEMMFSLEYNGTIAGLLDVVTSKANLFWKWEGNHVNVFRQETKHYVFDGDPSQEVFTAKINSAGGGGEVSEGGSQNSATSSHSTSVERDTGSIYDDLSTALDAMISSTGRYSISKQQGIITVTDTPAVQSKVDRYIDQINHIVSRKINVRTEVYEVTSNAEGNFGIDWDVVYDGSRRLGLDFTSAMGVDGSANLELGIISGGSHFNGSKAFVSALNDYADVSLVTSSTTFTTNGKPVPVQVADERSYLARMSAETDENGNKTVTMEPGSVLSGYTMSLTPRISSSGNVDLQFAVDMSQVNDIRTLEVAGGDQMIQLPDRTFKNFLQRVSVDSGSTIMIAGFERTENRSETSSVAGKSMWAAGGKKGGGQKKIMTMILITPYIMAD